MQRQLVEPALLGFIGDLIHQRDRVAVIFKHRFMNGRRRLIRLLGKHNVLGRNPQLLGNFLDGRKPTQQLGQFILLLANLVRHFLQ
ncbi:hypothetical protein D3C74_369790 [compost metagenome]